MNHKRKRSRTQTRSNTAGRRSLSSWPAWWDVIFHTRPKRREASQLARDVAAGRVDYDDAAFPLASNKPHNYLW